MANEIPISVVDRKIKVGRHVPATMTNIGKDYLSISLDNEWSSTNHRLRVTLYSESPYVSVQNWWDGKSAIEIPQEITSCPAFKITIANVSENGYERLVTQAMDEPIENPRNGHDEGAEPGVRTMDIIARVDSLAADLEHKRDTDYWRGKQGEPGEPGKDADIAGTEAAKDAANKAAESAIDAAARANSATSNANNAASNANEAASNANNAATNANESATNADTATMNANAAATEAHGAAANANEAAVNANETANQIKQRADSGEFNGKDGSDAAATDVRINGTSITADGVANIPAIKGNSNNSTENSYGLVKSRGQAYGIWVEPDGSICTNAVNKSDIDKRDNYFKPITSAWLDHAVKAAMCDGKGAAWTDGEKKAARERMNAADANKVYIMQKQIENLQGIAATEETDSTEAYTKAVPAGAQKWASLDKVGGKTVVWNQIVPTYEVNKTTNGVNLTSSGDGSFVMDGTAAASAYFQMQSSIVVTPGHIYIADIGNRNNSAIRFYDTLKEPRMFDDVTDAKIVTSAHTSITLALKLYIGESVSNVTVRPQLFDLTAMFGAGNEPATVEEFRAMFPDDYYPYNPGELMSAEVVDVESMGKNLLDVDKWLTDAGAQYEKNGSVVTITNKSSIYQIPFRFSDNDIDVTIHAGSITHTNGVRNPRFTLLKSNGDYAGNSYDCSVGAGIYDTKPKTVKASMIRGDYSDWSAGDTVTFDKLQIEKGTTATPYSPYGTKHTFPIPQSVREMGPGYGWSAGTVCNEIDFERKVYIQRVGSVDLNAYTWKAYQRDERPFYYSNTVFPNTKNDVYLEYVYVGDCISVANNSGSNMRFYYENGTVLSESHKPSGLFYYKLAEPIEIDLSNVLPDDNFIEVEAGGTIAFKQAYTQLPVPSSVTYQISTKEAIANA